MTKAELSLLTRELITENRLSDTFDLITDFAKTDPQSERYVDDLILILTRFNYIKENASLSKINYAEEAFERNKIVYDLLNLIRKIEKISEKISERNKQNANTNKKGSLQYLVEKSFNKSVRDDSTIDGNDKNLERIAAERGKIKILFLSANSNERPLRLDQEMRSIEEELENSMFRDRFTL